MLTSTKTLTTITFDQFRNTDLEESFSHFRNESVCYSIWSDIRDNTNRLEFMNLVRIQWYRYVDQT